MKLIIAIIRDSDNEPVSQGLILAGFRVTEISSTGGFLRRGSTTLMIGVEDEKVDQGVQVIRQTVGPATETGVRRGTLFVLNVENFDQV
jgi:uncharacterized protein YaaQ